MTLALACLAAARPARGDDDLLDDLSRIRANRLSGLRNVSVAEQANVGFPSAGRIQNVLMLSLLWPFPLGAS